MKIYVTTFLILMSYPFLSAQGASGRPSNNLPGHQALSGHNFGVNPLTSNIAEGDMLKSDGNITYSQTRLSYEKIDGSPYLNDEAIAGTLVMVGGTTMNDIPLQIDLFMNAVIATTRDGEELVLDTDIYDEVRVPVDGQEIILKKLNGEHPDKFYQVLYEDENMVFFKENSAIIKEAASVNGFEKSNDRFSQKSKYFIKYGDFQVEKVKLKKKDISRHLPEAKLSMMENNARNNGLKLKREADFIAFFKGGQG